MTPEDAVSELKEFLKEIDRFPNDDTFRCELDREGVKAILAAIRAAENDALERAAVVADGWIHPGEDTDGESNAGRHIRELKHKEAHMIREQSRTRCERCGFTNAKTDICSNCNAALASGAVEADRLRGGRGLCSDKV
jgi:hypothetical protein